MKPIKAVIFDIGRVILPVDWESVTNGLGLSESEAEQLKERVVNGEHYDRYERGEIETKEFFEQFPSQYDIHHPPERLVEAWNSMILEPFEGIESVLESLKQQVEIFTLSNTSQVHHDHFIEEYDLFDHFHEIHTSFSLGARKPEDKIYQSLLEAINHNAEETLFIDDLDENLSAAKSQGMNAEKSVNSVETTKLILKKYGLL
ncbi:MAG: HAD family phosphatase [Bdellovibrionales bacterium]|nr:HAD family phosphatase [Bdellovibrionales bacterium]